MVEIKIYLDRIASNLEKVKMLSKANNTELVVVTKCFHSSSNIVELLYKHGIETIADTHLESFELLNKFFDKHIKKMLFIVPPSMISERMSVIDYFYTAELKIIKMLSNLNLETKPNIIIPVELGDMREGLIPEEVIPFIKEALDYRGVNISGIAVNFGCLRGILPNESKLEQLANIKREVKRKLGYKLNIVSIGGTVVYDFLKAKILPPEINQIRIGEAIFFGYNMSMRKKIDELRQDAFIFSSEIIEIKEKRTEINGELGYNAFGERMFYERPTGTRIQAILNFGELTAPPSGLITLDDNIRVIGATHDHTVVDITDSDTNWKVGDFMRFSGDYNNIAHILMAPYVRKLYVRESMNTYSICNNIY